MQIITYPHPTLRHPSKPIKRVDAELRAIVRQMFDTMYEARGVGLAANQVDLPLRLFVVNTEGDPERGEELVFLNPVISRPKGSDEQEEGCLSLPQLYGVVRRPARVHIQAFGIDGREINEDLEGFAARVVQHELDHLDGVLFVDRLAEMLGWTLPTRWTNSRPSSRAGGRRARFRTTPRSPRGSPNGNSATAERQFERTAV